MRSSTADLNKQVLLSESHYEEQKLFWEKQLSGYENFVSLPVVASTATGNGMAQLSFELPEELSARLMQQSSNNDQLIYVYLSAVMSALMYRYLGLEDVLLLSPVSKTLESAHTLGDFVYIRTKPHAGLSFRELLLSCRQTVMDAYHHQDYPLKEVKPAGSNAADKLLSAVCIMMEGLHGRIASEPELVNIVFSRHGAGIKGHITFNDLHYRQEVISLIPGHITNWLKEVLWQLDKPIGEVEYLSKAEKEILLPSVKKSLPRKNTLVHVFTKQVKKHSHIAALKMLGREVSYQELDKWSDAIAQTLIGKGLRENEIVALYMTPGPAVAAAIIGVMKAGMAYLPVDTGLPVTRVQHILKDAAVAVVLTTAALSEQVPFDGMRILMEDIPRKAAAVNRTTADTGAYVIFTSGTTGTPKGVVVSQQAIANTICWRKNCYELKEGEKVLQLFGYAFDGFLTGFFTPLLSGSTLVMVDENQVRDVPYLLQLIREENITHFICVPSLFRELLEQSVDELNGLRVVTLAGENVPAKLISRCREKYPSLELANEYGPTESAVVTTCKRQLGEDDGGVIGTPVDYAEIRVLDDMGRLLPAGFQGNIYIGGQNLANGYLNKPALTGGKFPYLKLSGVQGKRYYDTGDTGFVDHLGQLHYTGRKDNQVKINGFRIELDEIANVLKSHTHIREAALIVKETMPGQQVIVCCYTTSLPVDATEIWSFLVERLPYYMLPAVMKELATMPVNTSGKINYAALHDIEVFTGTAAIGYVAPQDEREEALAAVWSDVLQHPMVGREDNFFLLDGNSIRAIQVLSGMRKRGYEVNIKDIFSYPVLAILAKHLVPIAADREPAAVQSNTSNCSPDTLSLLQTLYGDQLMAAYPLAPLQEGILFQSVSSDHPGTYMVQSFADLEGPFDVAIADRAMDYLCQRHEVLRSCFLYEGLERPLQLVLNKVNIKVHSDDLSALPTPAAQAAVIEQYKEQDIAASFDLSKGPLLRLAVFRLSPEHHKLIWSFHHIIMDGWCFGILSKEFFIAYKALSEKKDINLPAPAPYRQYIEWIEKKDKELIRQYWMNYLHGYTELASVHQHVEGERTGKLAYDVHYYMLSRQESDSLRSMAAINEVSISTLMQAIWGILLARYTNSRDVVFGAVSAARPYDMENFENMVGVFINTLPVRIAYEETTAFSVLVKKLQQQLILHEANAFMSLSAIQHLTPLRNHLFDHIFIFNYPIENLSPESIHEDYELGLGISLSGIGSRERTSYAMNITVFAGDNIQFKFTYDPRLYDARFVQQVSTHLNNVIQHLLQDPESTITGINLLGSREEQEILTCLSGTGGTYKLSETILQRMERKLGGWTDADAFIFGEEVMSAGEFNGKANALAYRLMEQGVAPNMLIPVLVKRGLELPVCLAAVLKAGAAFVPVDPYWPENRIREVLTELDAPVLLVNESQLEQRFNSWRPLLVKSGALPVNGKNPGLPVLLTDPIYCIFTSGSTGKPKGALNQHLGIVNRFSYMDKRFEPAADDVILLTSNHSFDSAIWQLLWGITNGNKVIIPADAPFVDLEQIIQLVHHHKVTITDMVPSVFNLLVKLLEENVVYASRLLSLREILVGGEAMSGQHVSKFHALLSKVSVHNTYGPTETSIGTIFHKVLPDDGLSVPIGSPIDNVKVLLLDNNNRLVPRGVTGELYLGGVCVGKGYLNDVTLTGERFAQPVHKEYGEGIFYRTGDKARLSFNNRIEFMGRSDNQVKIRGVRIELEEVENRLLQYPHIREAVVIWEPNLPRPVLAAFMVAAAAVDTDKLRTFLLGYMPESMVPSRFIRIDKIPLTSNMKADKKQLAQILRTHEQHHPATNKPVNDLEQRILHAWEEIFDGKEIDTQEHFFELGGNSLDLMKLYSRLKSTINFRESLVTLVQYPTIASLAGYLSGGSEPVADYTSDERRRKGKESRTEQRNRRKGIQHIQQDGYDMHSNTYTLRVKDRKKYAFLDLEDSIITKLLAELPFKKRDLLIDAGCSTGDRLRKLVEHHPAIGLFGSIYGIDFSQGMLDIAQQQQINGSNLYDRLLCENLHQPQTIHQADLVLCLWGIINESVNETAALLKNLGAMTADNGYLICDVTTDSGRPPYQDMDKVARMLYPEYDLQTDEQTFLIQREDKTFGYFRTFTMEEINGFAALLGMRFHQVYGYNHDNTLYEEIPLQDDALIPGAADNYSGLLLCFKKIGYAR